MSCLQETEINLCVSAQKLYQEKNFVETSKLLEKVISLRSERREKNVLKSDETNSEDQAKEDSTKDTSEDDEDEIFFQITLDMNYHLARYKAKISTMDSLREVLEQLCERVQEIKGKQITRIVQDNYMPLFFFY